MKIAFLYPQFPHIALTCQMDYLIELIKAGHKVHIYSLLPPTTAIQEEMIQYGLDKQVHFLNVKSIEWKARFLLPSLWIQAIPVINLSMWGSCRRAISYFLRLLLFLEKGERYDVIHCHYDVWTWTLGTWLKRCRKAKILLYSFWGDKQHLIHNFDYVYREAPNLFLFLLTYTDRLTAISKDLLLTMQEYLMSRGLKRGRQPIVYLPAVIRPSLFRLSRTSRVLHPERPCRLITVARFSKEKGIDVLIHVLGQLKRQGVLFHWTLIGCNERILPQGYTRRVVDEWIQKEQIQNETTVYENKSRAFIIEKLYNSDVFVLPSLVEGMGTVFLEAGAAGLPIVATNVGGIPEIVHDGKGGYLVPPGNSHALAERLMLLLNHPEQWYAMGIYNRQFVLSHFDVTLWTQRLLGYYQEDILGTQK